MTNDKTVTMSRELADRIQRLLFGSMFEFVETGERALEMASELRALLDKPDAVIPASVATPVVERQDSISPYDAIFHAISGAVDIRSLDSLAISAKDFQSSLAAKGFRVSPVAVVLPDRKPITPGFVDATNLGWNACLDKVKELNR